MRGNADQQIYEHQLNKTLTVLQGIVESMDMNVSKLEDLRMQPQTWVNPNKDPRFTPLEYPLPRDNEKGKAAAWCGLMAKEVFEHAFALFLRGDLDEDEVKCLASSSFLLNYLRLSQRLSLGEK